MKQAEERLERFVTEGGFIVTTGQQPILFGGPLFILYKALTLIKIAEHAQEILKVTVLPVFWNASEDHDLIVLISGGIDISFTAMTSVAEYAMALYIINVESNIAMAFVIAIVVGIGLGGFNATLIYFLRIPAIITTIATLNIYYGLLSFFSGGKWIYALPGWFRDFHSFLFPFLNFYFYLGFIENWFHS